MKLRSPGEALYLFLLMLLDFRLQQHCPDLWFLFIAPTVLAKGQPGDVAVKSLLSVVALCLVPGALHLVS
jgi:hypothetical protein